MKKVLICDDSQWMRGLIRAELNKHSTEGKNHSVIEASNGKEALDLIEKENFYVAFIDWTMPLIDGIELVKKIRQSTKYNLLKVVMITALSGKGDIMQALKEGVDDYITKPINSRESSMRFREALIDLGLIPIGAIS